MNPFNRFEHRPIDCNKFTNETRASAEALHVRESPFSALNRETVPKHAPNRDFHPPEKSAGENNHPRFRDSQKRPSKHNIPVANTSA